MSLHQICISPISRSNKKNVKSNSKSKIDTQEALQPLQPLSAPAAEGTDGSLRGPTGGAPVARRASLTSCAGAHDVCRICHCEAEPSTPLIAPCSCAGTLRFVHQACLQQWIKSADTKSCELCRFDFKMTTKIKPFRKWQKLDMSTVERRKITCSVSFHIIAITCVVWSLYVLIHRTTEEIRDGILAWPFWTKLIVVAIGFTGGLVFMYVQCKMYVQLCKRWRAYNRVIYVQSYPEGTVHKAMTSSTQTAAAVEDNKSDSAENIMQESELL